MISIPQQAAEIDNIRSEGMNDMSIKEYFHGFVSDWITEIELLESLKGNTNIVGIEDHQVIEKKDGIGWDILIRMELLMPFVKYISENSLTKRKVIQLGIDICCALEYCN